MSVPSEDMGSLADVRQLSRYVSVDLRADGFRERLDTDADLQMKRIGVSRRILVASPTLLAKEGEPTTPAELGKLPILHQEQQGGNIWHLTADDGDTCTVAVKH